MSIVKQRFACVLIGIFVGLGIFWTVSKNRSFRGQSAQQAQKDRPNSTPVGNPDAVPRQIDGPQSIDFEDILAQPTKGKSLVNFHTFLDNADSAELSALTGQLLDSFEVGRISSGELEVFLGLLGEKADEDLAKRLIEDPVLLAGNEDAIASFVRSWTLKNPDVALKYFQSSGGDDLGGADHGLVNALFAGLIASDPEKYMGLRSSVAPILEPSLVGAWAAHRRRTVGFDLAFQEFNALAKNGDQVIQERAVAHLLYQSVKAGLLPAQSAAAIAAKDPKDAMSFGMTFGSTYPQEALEWAAAMEVGDPARASALNGVMAAAGKTKPDLALDFVENFEGSADEKINLLFGLQVAFRSTDQDDWVKQIDEILYEMKAPGWEFRPGEEPGGPK